MIYPNIILDDIETDLEIGFVKGEWQRIRKEVEKQNELKKTENGEIRVAQDATSAPGSSHIHHLQNENVIDFATKKAHEWKNNKRIVIPEIEDPEREIRNNFVKKELLSVAAKFVKENCKENGMLKSTNLSKFVSLKLIKLRSLLLILLPMLRTKWRLITKRTE